MKKRIAMLMCAAALMMTACGSENAQGNASEVSSVAESSVVKESNVGAESAVAESTEASAEAEAVEEEIKYAFGEYTETGYDAEWLGYRFTTPEGCMLAQPEQLMSLLGVSMDVISGDYDEALLKYAEQSLVYDLYAYYPSTSNINICVQNTITSIFTLEQLVETSVYQLEKMETMSITVHEEREKVEIAGREYIKVEADTTMNGTNMKQMIYITMVPDYVINITVTCLEGNEAEAEALIAAFSEL